MVIDECETLTEEERKQQRMGIDEAKYILDYYRNVYGGRIESIIHGKD